jgi:hypothetical protein
MMAKFSCNFFSWTRQARLLKFTRRGLAFKVFKRDAETVILSGRELETALTREVIDKQSQPDESLRLLELWLLFRNANKTQFHWILMRLLRAEAKP